jgi:hypothetical protein
MQNRVDCNFVEVATRIEKCNSLIIDEVSMISKKVFKKIEMVCHGVRTKTVYFGGLQVILAGDFVQLPPVATTNMMTPASICSKVQCSRRQ